MKLRRWLLLFPLISILVYGMVAGDKLPGMGGEMLNGLTKGLFLLAAWWFTGSYARPDEDRAIEELGSNENVE